MSLMVARSNSVHATIVPILLCFSDDSALRHQMLFLKAPCSPPAACDWMGGGPAMFCVIEAMIIEGRIFSAYSYLCMKQRTSNSCILHSCTRCKCAKGLRARVKRDSWYSKRQQVPNCKKGRGHKLLKLSRVTAWKMQTLWQTAVPSLKTWASEPWTAIFTFILRMLNNHLNHVRQTYVCFSFLHPASTSTEFMCIDLKVLILFPLFGSVSPHSSPVLNWSFHKCSSKCNFKG